MSQQTEPVEVVCCGCFPRHAKADLSAGTSATRERSPNSSPSGRRAGNVAHNARVSVYHDAFDGAGSLPREDSLTFFDALQDPDPTGLNDEYPIITTSSVPHVDFHMSLDNPETLLASHQMASMKADIGKRLSPGASADANGTKTNDNHSDNGDDDDLFFTPQYKPKKVVTMTSMTGGEIMSPPPLMDGSSTPPRSSSPVRVQTPPASPPKTPKTPRTPKLKPLRQLSTKLSHVFHHKREISQKHMENLQKPRVKVMERGYPGELTQDEVDKCLALAKELQKPERHIEAEIVYSLGKIEEAVYALCRFLRAVKFDYDALLVRLEEQKEQWIKARNANFYPDLEESLGVELPVFLQQYPFLSIGRAKNGCPVTYFKAGRLQPEGIMCITTVEKSMSFFWHQSYHSFQENLKASQEIDPNVVRMEGITVLDLTGLSYSAAKVPEAMDILKLAGKVGDYFPESMHCMLILNAPGFFSMLWTVIKALLDPRTAKRIQVFSSDKKGIARLKELVDENQIPSDYGGPLPSVLDAIQNQGASKSKYDVQLKSLKRREKVTLIYDLAAGEKSRIRVYTRSVSSCVCTLHEVGSKKVLVTKKVRGNLETTPVENTCTDIITDLIGPGKYELVLTEQDDPPKSKSSQSRGWFLIAVDTI